ncbi:MAG: tetratricopeptide repeat protein [Solidesulfovibrio sp. DCME]|uniref:tetratricopeptide repeat protein n=1 Tax=Solidesulfovibrio sp. DCME TaxID=3447380 RepID=UPI003D0BB431
MEDAPATDNEAAQRAGERFKGVFSTQSQAVIGFGTTRRKVKQNIFVFAEEQADGSFTVRNLNKHFIPSGRPRLVTKDELLASFLPEPDLYLNKVVPMMRQVREAVDVADQHRAQGEHMSAEFEYKNALRVDEEHIRATFGLGLTYLDRGELDNANLVCRRIITLESAFGEEHKHLFNEFGIKMRKHGMYPQALRYYFKAYRLTKGDENLHYNIARTYYEKGKLKLARKFLEMAQGINPGLSEATGLLRAIEKKEAETEADARPLAPQRFQW